MLLLFLNLNRDPKKVRTLLLVIFLQKSLKTKQDKIEAAEEVGLEVPGAPLGAQESSHHQRSGQAGALHPGLVGPFPRLLPPGGRDPGSSPGGRPPRRQGAACRRRLSAGPGARVASFRGLGRRRPSLRLRLSLPRPVRASPGRTRERAPLHSGSCPGRLQIHAHRARGRFLGPFRGGRRGGGAAGSAGGGAVAREGTRRSGTCRAGRPFPASALELGP